MLDPAFVADCPYAPEAILFDEILEDDGRAGLVVARMPTHAQLPFTASQRAHPSEHPECERVVGRLHGHTHLAC